MQMRIDSNCIFSCLGNKKQDSSGIFYHIYFFLEQMPKTVFFFLINAGVFFALFFLQILLKRVAKICL